MSIFFIVLSALSMYVTYPRQLGSKIIVPRGAVPRPFSKLTIVPEAFYKIELRFAICFDQNCNNIVTVRHIGNAEQTPVNLGCPRDLALFAEVDRCYHWSKIFGTPR